MAIEDLDLEFEDEEEGVKSDALEVDTDLSFSASPEVDSRGVRVKPTSKKIPQPKTNDAIENPNLAKGNTSSKVANINQGRPKPKAQLQARPVSQVKPSANIAYANVDPEELQQLRSEVEQLKIQMQSISHQADVRVAVAQAEKEFLVEYVSNAKVLDHQVTQILQRINKKVPALASEAQTIKKYMSEFLKKSVPKKKGEGE
jgi:hypothetical protein